ncbi:MAG: hypothetical protein EOO01_23150, partial [Chitinophagaceae bacterium]
MRFTKRYITTACCLAIFSFVLFIACRKTKEVSVASKALFNAEAAKEFYYGVFRKSAEYAMYDPQNSGIKSPDWKHGVYQRKGDVELVEFPLLKVKGRVLIPTPDSLSRADLSRLVNASLSRIVFIKKGDKVLVREIEYLPDLSYASGKSFDISSNNITKLDRDFSGRIIQRYWDGKELSRMLVVNGAVKSKGRIRPVAQQASGLPTAASTSSRGRNCSVFEICEWQRDCEYVWVG